MRCRWHGLKRSRKGRTKWSRILPETTVVGKSPFSSSQTVENKGESAVGGFGGIGRPTPNETAKWHRRQAALPPWISLVFRHNEVVSDLRVRRAEEETCKVTVPIKGARLGQARIFFDRMGSCLADNAFTWMMSRCTSYNVAITANRVSLAMRTVLRILHWLGEALTDTGGQLHAYALMTNHVHLLVTPDRAATVPKLIISLGRRYVQYVNTSYRRTGAMGQPVQIFAYTGRN